MPTQRKYSLFAALTLFAGTLEQCTSRQQQPSTGPDSNNQDQLNNGYNADLDPQNPNSMIVDYNKRYEQGLAEPVEKQVFEKTDPTTGKIEKYIKLDVPVSNPNVYANDQDTVKAVTNQIVYQQVDGDKSEVETTENAHHYHSSPVFYRYYPDYTSPYYNGGYRAGYTGHHGFITGLKDRIYNITERQTMNKYLSKAPGRNGIKNVFGKAKIGITHVTPENFKATSKLSAFRNISKSFGTRGFNGPRIGMRSSFGG